MSIAGPWSSFRATRTGSVLLTLLVVAVQLVVTLAVMFVVGLAVILAARAPYEDMLSVLGWLFWSAAAAIVTTAFALVLGMPIRLIAPARRWWRANGEVMLAGAFLGGALIVFSFLLAQPSTITGASSERFEVLTPNGWLLLAGWLILSFSCAHVLWPRRWTSWLRSIGGRRERLETER